MMGYIAQGNLNIRIQKYKRQDVVWGWDSKGNRLIRLKSQSINKFYNLIVLGVGIDGTVTSSTQNSSPVIGSINLRPSTRFKPLGIVPGGRKFTVV